MAARKGWGKKEVVHQPDGTIRRSQVVTTFGPGAMVDLIGDAILVGGLDYWLYGAKTVIQEPRLRDHLAERLQRIGIMLSFENAFREPPACDDKAPSKQVGVSTLEFPQWFVCQSPSCRSLAMNKALELKRRPGSDDKHYVHQCNRSTTSEAIPVRFVGACRRGHVQDFPWLSFAHLGKERCGMPDLALVEGKTGDFSEIKVECRGCGATSFLVAAMRKNSGLTCDGQRPWLGGDHEGCTEDLRLIVRTASNSYFAQVTSALSIPDEKRELEEAVRKLWPTLVAATAETLPHFRKIPEVNAGLTGYGDDAVLSVVEAIKTGAAPPREPLRTAEYKLFVNAPKEQPGELPPREEPFWARRHDPEDGLPDGIHSLVVAPKLREVRAQVGFTRIVPMMPDMQGTYESGVRTARLSLAQDWLPATTIQGEGVFVRLDEAKVAAWESKDVVRRREDALRAGYDVWRRDLEKRAGEGEAVPPFPGARFYLLHSLAHLLISAISLECGYAASAIRERIYCARPTDETGVGQLPMAAILLSTGTSGSEGTLGGLVEQGRAIRSHVVRAWDLGALCSSDPVCALHSPADDPAERHLEGAACHGCLYVAECSCEWFNRYLDRALVVPTLGHDAELAFFSVRP
ncbi:MAG: DUF1998 domain-containing protein [Labilithrix sp.]|nr:DUF1998 domain-containing protein [Labilithrix sp.]MCW5817000.1 DUF1998 domain-containing protein [Labilithrix sp.]